MSELRKLVEIDVVKMAWFDHLYPDRYKPTVVQDYPEEPIEYDWKQMLSNAYKLIVELEKTQSDHECNYVNMGGGAHIDLGSYDIERCTICERKRKVYDTDKEL